MTKTEQRIQALLESALEGGSNYWYLITGYNYPPGKTRKDFEFPHVELPLTQGGSIVIADMEEPQHGYTLDREACYRGMKVLRQDYSKHYRDVIEDNADAITGDVYLQCCLFGEVVFG